MDMSTLSIPLAYAAFAVVVLFALAGTNLRWKVKVPLAATLPFFALVLWYGIDSYRGWPTDQGMPPDVQVLGTVVREPSKKDRDPGRIFIWGVPLQEKEIEPGIFDYRPMSGEPRAYSLPYERKLHEAVEKARQLAAQGRPVILKMRMQGDPPVSGGYSDPEDRYFIEELPPPAMPKKGGH